ncbi:hypothetical protein L202_07315 [Cryptococcus amylolentus CBS 6039]|uniref:Zn(2)-C6 fungal-type domain-containing protein n=1 Tax=Cryptococcus amylolentus CBS 6039 TaxID=1295533 RepID=A0A1E3HDG8_9TREE|nr:hypothetical protein L202_07315 [Cryptococcus amylolentus CBS 6039]ODN73786.1 hypothetical protein L202_07315 [Cryptococcus amylolentus CBS 6039]
MPPTSLPPYDFAAHSSSSNDRRTRNSERTSRACTTCRSRKTKCTGELPMCQTCLFYGKNCEYPAVDKRTTDRSAQLKIERLQARVQELESILSIQRNNACLSPGQDEQSDDDEDMAPYETGRLVLSSTGNLHLHPSATFYCPAHVVPEWQHALNRLNDQQPELVTLPAYLATYLPLHTTPEHHRHLLDLAFDRLLCFGANPFKDKFLQAMDVDPDARGLYFSPLLHLALLGVGWRYCQDREMLMRHYPRQGGDNRGDEYYAKAQVMIMDEANEPCIGNMFALLVMTLYYVGRGADTLAGACFTLCQFQCLNFRVHKQCDGQLGELDLEPECELDNARRDIWHFCLNFSAWWATFYAQPVLPMINWGVDQRPPYVHSNHPNGNVRALSLMAAQHSQLSYYGFESLSINHLLKMPNDMRVKRVRELGMYLTQWQQNLPPDVAWPIPPGAPIMHPGNIVTQGMYCTYIILLYRPYLIEIGGGPNLIPEALQRCLECTQDIVDMAHYMVDHHGVMKAPLSWQHVLYVGSTILILQVAGLPNITEEQRLWALDSLRFIQEALKEFAYVWVAAGRTGSSLRTLQDDCTPSKDMVVEAVGDANRMMSDLAVDLAGGVVGDA